MSQAVQVLEQVAVEAEIHHLLDEGAQEVLVGLVTLLVGGQERVEMP